VGNEAAAGRYDDASATRFLFAGVARLVGAMRLEKMALSLRHSCMEGVVPADGDWAIFVDAIIDFIETAEHYHRELIASL